MESATYKEVIKIKDKMKSITFKINQLEKQYEEVAKYYSKLLETLTMEELISLMEEDKE